jgi:hypothetical protein
MSVELTRIYSTAVIHPGEAVGVEILVLQELSEGLDNAADALQLEYVDFPDVRTESVSDLRKLLSILWHDESEELAAFLDQLVFTRQIPLEESPIERWSLAELWTRSYSVAGGAITGMGIAHITGYNGVVLVISGVFGTLLIRPLSAISQGIAEGLRPAVRDATEQYARRWLAREEASPPVPPRRTATRIEAPESRERSLEAKARVAAARQAEIELSAAPVLWHLPQSFEEMAPWLERLESRPDGESAVDEANRHLTALPAVREDATGLAPGASFDTPGIHDALMGLMRLVDRIESELPDQPSAYLLSSIRDKIETLETILRRWTNR